MNNPLYTTEILRLSTSLGEQQALDRVDGSSDVRSPTCGSIVRAFVQLDECRRIQRVALDVSACAFGQASAALVERDCAGRNRAEMAEALDRMSDWLLGLRSAEPWPGAQVLAPARSRPPRHAAILLPFRAVLAALDAVP